MGRPHDSLSSSGTLAGGGADEGSGQSRDRTKRDGESSAERSRGGGPAKEKRVPAPPSAAAALKAEIAHMTQLQRLEGALSDAMAALKAKEDHCDELLEERKTLLAENERMRETLGRTEEVYVQAEGQNTVDREVKSFLDQQLRDTEEKLAAATHRNDTLEVQLGVANSMKE